MKRMIATTCVLVLALVLSAHAAESEGGWRALFDGKSLDAWQHKEGGWAVEDGAMALQKGGGYIWTKEAFGDFVLEGEFKVAPGCNSGIFFRTDPKNPVQGGFEIQVLDSHGRDNPGKHHCGALYDAKAPTENAVKPAGQWNHFVLACNGPKITFTLNGKKVVDVNIDEWDTANQNPDGSKNKFKTALKDLPRTGRIGFQDHGKPVWFRKVRVKAD